MSNKPLLSDLMESLIFLHNDGWLNKHQIKSILKKYNVNEIQLTEKKMICFQEGIITTVEI